MQKYDVIIVGAGAAGLMCAIRAGRRGRRVLVLDAADRAGAKIRISGGGRCNFTNSNIGAAHYISESPHFCASALRAYPPKDFVALVDRHNIEYHEKTLGQYFCNEAAHEIIHMLLAECQEVSVEIRLNERVTTITKDDLFHVQTSFGDVEAPSLVMATGGLSIPKMGATDLAHQVAQQFGLALTETRPGLVPLTFEGQELAMMANLTGVALEVIATCQKKSFRENMVFTHRGLSGPAILQVSSFWREGQPITINLLPDTDAEAFLIERKKTRGKAILKTILNEVLPQRLAQAIAELHPSTTPIADMTDKTLRQVAATLKSWTLIPSGTEGYDKAEVTLGGISTRELSSKTMESSKVPGLFFVGEAVDVTGWLGGYNLQWAWSSGWAAGSVA